jgi:hypothetical protein
VESEERGMINTDSVSTAMEREREIEKEREREVPG